MRRILLSPGWLGRHFALVFFLLTFWILGRWQWDVSRSPTGGLQNTLYAFQWWSFGLIFIYGWWRMIKEELRGGTPVLHPPTTAVPLGDEAWIPTTLSRHRLLPPPADATEHDLLDYRRYLAELHALDEAREASESV